MSIPPAETNARQRLRLDAETRLKEGSAPPAKAGSTGADALRLLYSLASSPATADDALKLLHELQVHQVELDLQHEQVEATWRELAEDLARYKGFYESAPVGFFNLDREGHILEGNIAGAELFGLEPGALHGRRLESLLAPAIRPVLLEVLQKLRDGVSTSLSREVKSGVEDGWLPSRLVASVAPDGASFLLVVMPPAARQPELKLV